MNRIIDVADRFGVSVVKGDERYIIVFIEATKAGAMRQLGRWAANPELSFTWYDAACATQRIRAELAA